MLLAGAFMVVLDFFIVNVALPSIATDLGAGDSSLEWVVAGYGLDLRRLPDHRRPARRRPRAPARLRDRPGAVHGRLGRLRPRSQPHHAVVARIAQGVAGAIVMPQVLAILGVTYRGPDYVRALSFYGMALGLAAVGGQLVGGALVDDGRRRPRLAQLLPDQRADRPGRAGRWRPGSCPSRAPSGAQRIDVARRGDRWPSG